MSFFFLTAAAITNIYTHTHIRKKLKQHSLPPSRFRHFQRRVFFVSCSENKVNDEKENERKKNPRLKIRTFKWLEKKREKKRREFSVFIHKRQSFLNEQMESKTSTDANKQPAEEKKRNQPGLAGD